MWTTNLSPKMSSITQESVQIREVEKTCDFEINNVAGKRNTRNLTCSVRMNVTSYILLSCVYRALPSAEDVLHKMKLSNKVYYISMENNYTLHTELPVIFPYNMYTSSVLLYTYKPIGKFYCDRNAQISS